MSIRLFTDSLTDDPDAVGINPDGSLARAISGNPTVMVFRFILL
jgi:hypothetical protein